MPLYHNIQSIFGWCQNHDHSPAFQCGPRFDLRYIAELVCQPSQQLLAFLGVEHVPSPELNRRFDFVSVFQEAACMSGFELQIMIVRIGPESQLFHLHGVLLLLRLFLLLLFLVHELAKIDHLANRWVRIGCDFDQILVEGASNLEGPGDVCNLVFVVGLDYAYFA